MKAILQVTGDIRINIRGRDYVVQRRNVRTRKADGEEYEVWESISRGGTGIVGASETLLALALVPEDVALSVEELGERVERATNAIAKAILANASVEALSVSLDWIRRLTEGTVE